MKEKNFLHISFEFYINTRKSLEEPKEAVQTLTYIAMYSLNSRSFSHFSSLALLLELWKNVSCLHCNEHYVCVLRLEILDLKKRTCYHPVYGWKKIPVSHFVKPPEVRCSWDQQAIYGSFHCQLNHSKKVPLVEIEPRVKCC